jgi:hypothetical protein
VTGTAAWHGGAALRCGSYASKGRDEELRVEKVCFSLTSAHGDEDKGGEACGCCRK